ncbi:MAG: hypothetical protein WCY70_05560 [Methanoculleus sp.]
MTLADRIDIPEIASGNWKEVRQVAGKNHRGIRWRAGRACR